MLADHLCEYLFKRFCDASNKNLTSVLQHQSKTYQKFCYPKLLKGRYYGVFNGTIRLSSTRKIE